MRTTQAYIGAFLLFCFFSCDTNDDSPENQGPSTDLIAQMTAAMGNLNETQWVFTNYSQNPLEAEYQNLMTLVFLNLEDDTIQFGGRGVFNNFGGSFTVNEAEGLIVNQGETLTTLVGSTNPRDLEVERDYIENLEKAVFFEIEDSVLRLYLGDKDSSDTEIMRFTPTS
ncbi:MAG: META domain-containing protein [Bacteroidota bacterium]